MKNPLGKQAREECKAAKSIRRGDDSKPLWCDCNNWPGDCNGVGWCRQDGER